MIITEFSLPVQDAYSDTNYGRTLPPESID